MDTKLRAWCAGIAEAAALIVVATVPLFVNYYSFRIFEPDKQSIVLALGVLAGVVALVALVEGGLTRLREVRRQPLALAAGALVLATAIATAGSIAPRTSFFGSGERAQGLLALLAGVALFAAVAWLAIDPERRGRLVAWTIMASVPVAGLAIVQALGIELVVGEVESKARVFGTLSNPIFLGAYLMLVVPLTVGRCVAAWRDSRTQLLGGLVSMLFLQLVALILSASRGALLGLLAGLVVLALATALGASRRRVAGALVVLALVGIGFLALFNHPASPLAPLRGVPYLGRLGEIADTSRGSSAARMRIWRATDRLLRATPPQRLLVGHGPETFKYALLPHSETYIAGRGQAERLVDRAHNVLLDALVMTGLLGAGALFLVYGAWLYVATVAAGLALTTRQRRWLASLLAIGTLAAAATWLAPPVQPVAGALMHLGLIAGLMAYLVILWWRRWPVSDGADVLAFALLGIGVAAVVEAAFGIQTVVTQAMFWVLAGLLVGLARAPLTRAAADSVAADASGSAATGKLAARRLPEPAGAADSRLSDPRLRRGSGPAIRIRWSAAGVAVGLVLGGALALIVHGAYLYGTPASPDALPVVATVIVLTWLAGLVLAADAGLGPLSVSLAALASLLAMLGIRGLSLALAKDAAVLFGAHLWWLVAVALLSGALLRPGVDRRAPVLRPLAGGVYVLLGISAVAFVYARAMLPVQADIYFQSAVANFGAAMTAADEATFQARYEAANELYARAVARNRLEPLYPMRWGELYTQLAANILASPAPDAQAKAQAVTQTFERAQAYAVQAEQLEPLLPYHAFNRGHVQLLFAQGLTDETQRRTVAANAAAAFQEAFDKVPYDPAVATEFGVARLLEGRTAEAVALLEHAKQLDPRNPNSLQALAQAYRQASRTQEAFQAAYDALQAGAKGPEPLTLLGDLERERGQKDDALNYYVQAAQLAPQNWAILYNLGLLYRDNGQSDKAMDSLVRALQLAPETERDRIQAAIDGLLGGGPAPL